MKIVALLLIIFMGFFQAVYAQDILLSTNQTEYYFKTGENAIIPIEINNTYRKQISGTLEYAITQLINQGNIQLSNYNTEKKSLSINEENTKVSLDLAKSDTPSNFTVNINFNYNENGDRIVSLGPIIIHFVSDESQKNTHQQNKMQSSSQPNTQSKQQDLFSQQQQQMEQLQNELLGNQQDLFSQQQQQMEQLQNNLFGNQQNLSQNKQQQLQNNQLAQDSSALKQQLEKQVQNQEQIKKEFEQKLFSNNDFLNRHQELLKNRYNMSRSNLNAMSNVTGSFDIKYNNTNGKWATLQGNMKNGTITEINEQSQAEQEKLLQKLKQNILYRQFHSKLLTEGFSQNDITFDANGNETNIILKYEDQKHANAKIIANFVNDEIKQVTLEDRNSNPLNLMLLIIIVVTIVSAISIYFVIKKFINKERFTIIDSSSIPNLKSFDHVTESKKLIDEAIKYHDKGRYKEAFGTAGKSIRLFLSHDSGIKREITSEELIQLIQKNNYPVDDIRECLKITDLVEFAKLKASEYDFKKIISLFNKLSNEQNFDNT
ncbi:MAG: hypothetical protein E6L04_10145 [Thaumarchaeota archaeon]|nr:MAG: hypothetical protein E6L04_10145 [Nitrososphaerota archaeon]